MIDYHKAQIVGDLNEVASLINGSIDATETLSNILLGQPEIVVATLEEAEKKFSIIEQRISEGNDTVSVDLWERLRDRYRDQIDKWKNHVTQK
jgi:hypothetical protein